MSSARWGTEQKADEGTFSALTSAWDSGVLAGRKSSTCSWPTTSCCCWIIKPGAMRPDTRTTAFPSQINEGTHELAHRQTKCDTFDLYGGIYLLQAPRCARGNWMWRADPENSRFGWFDLSNWGDNRVSDSQASLTVRGHQRQGAGCGVLKGECHLLALTKRNIDVPDDRPSLSLRDKPLVLFVSLKILDLRKS